MSLGVGGASPKLELERLCALARAPDPIPSGEYGERIAKAQHLMRSEGLSAVYLHAGTNLAYFTGLRWGPSERMVGAVLPAQGAVEFIAPRFELGSIREYAVIEGRIWAWEEHASPYVQFVDCLRSLGIEGGRIGVDESTPFFVTEGIREANQHLILCSATPVTAGCRMIKSPRELALLQQAKDMTLQVHRSAAGILRAGISTRDVESFINEAHVAIGAKGSSFCIVLFGTASSFPHGVKNPQELQSGDMVLIDTGCLQEGYNSDITRSYVFGQANPEQRRAWAAEKAAQAAAFSAAKLGVPCGQVDIAARASLEASGYGPGYELPGLPHRTGHGIGLDIHEWPYLVTGDDTPLAAGMCFSNEPMLVLPGKFGVRLEDHFYMTPTGPRWFTQPSHSIDDPFGVRDGMSAGDRPLHS